jgi:DNA-binding NtrC family response regulator
MANDSYRLLIIEDDEDLADVLRSHFKTKGYEIEVRTDALGPLTRLRKMQPESPWDIILTDLKMPGMDGLEFIREVRHLCPHLPVILMTAHGGVETAVTAVKEGAYDFVMKPLNFAELAVSLERAVKHRRLSEENQALRDVIRDNKSGRSMIAKSAGMKAIQELIDRVAGSTATILITGESGSGKEVVAKNIHQASKRNDKPFVAINCAAIPETLLESELFGFAKGSFTGAVDKKLGLFEEANGGTLFLDEIGDLTGALQAKLLRVLQDKKIKRIGENQTRDVDVRIIAATHKILETEVREKRFREDLFFRLNVIPIRIPALRERREDIIPLAEHFLRKFSLANGGGPQGFEKDALEYLSRAQWRGNVRELENAIERAVVLCRDSRISEKDLLVFPAPNGIYAAESEPPSRAPSTVPQAASTAAQAPAAPLEVARPQGFSDSLAALFSDIPDDKLPTLEEWQLLYIHCVVERVEGVRERARKILKIDRKTLYKKIDQFEEFAGKFSKNLAN